MTSISIAQMYLSNPINQEFPMKIYQITAYHLPNISSEQYIDHAIKTAKKVNPHLSISIAKVISFDAMCNNIEEFINEIQDVVLYQKLD